eukprot:scaffold237983_cov17-Tisochrysis_lutea.AAC.2
MPALKGGSRVFSNCACPVQMMHRHVELLKRGSIMPEKKGGSGVLSNIACIMQMMGLYCAGARLHSPAQRGLPTAQAFKDHYML